jgi:hypothetical protein
MLQKRIGYGQTLSVTVGAGPAVELGAIVDGWSGPDTSSDDVETTVLADTFKTFKRAQIDPGTFTFTLAYDPADAESILIGDLYNSGDVATWTITYSDEGGGAPDSESFDGYINGLGREMTKGSLVSCNVSIKVSGDPGYSGTGGSA